MSEYLVPFEDSESEFVEKRSRFISHLWRVETEAEARARIEETKKKYYDARHNCWCYILKEGNVVRYSDDGEPQGTAGIPMLEVFRREGLCNVVCVVTRYFGGVLLGAGGLLRAYTKSSKDALYAAGVSVVRRWVEAELPCSYSLVERLKLEVAAFDGIVTDMDYAASVTIRALVPEERAEDFKARIFDLSAGAVTAALTGEAFRAVPLK